MFRNDGNYEFFLRQYDKYLSPVADTYAYCLLGNHFHILLRVRESSFIFNSKRADIALRDTHELVSHQFRKFFQSYSMAYNKQHQRLGTLFQTPFKRVLIESDNYFTNLIYYVHANPQSHGLTNDFRTWKWSSYNSILSDKPSRLNKNEVISWFGSKGDFEKFHREYRQLVLDEKLIIEDF